MSTQLPQSHQARRLGGAQIAALVAAGLIALLSTGLLAAGAWGLWGENSKDADGFFTSGYERYSTSTRAITTENLDMDLDGPVGLLDESMFGKLRLKVEPRADTPVFVGIGRTRDVDAYLSGAARDVVTDLELDPFQVDYDRVRGGERPARPRSQDFWVASAQGRDTQTLTWDVDDGDWSIVVMNADGSAGVDTLVDTGVKLPWLTALGWGVLGAGLIGALVAWLITLVAIRGRRPAQPTHPIAA